MYADGARFGLSPLAAGFFAFATFLAGFFAIFLATFLAVYR
jgi:hypothetical protein